MRFERILFPVDFSEYSRACLKRASQMFSDEQPREFHFVYILKTPTDFAVWDGDPQAEVFKRLTDVVAEFKHPGQYETQVAVAHGHPATETCRYAAEQGCDLIVMATHGRTGLRHMFLGSTAEQVVRQAHCPVLTLRLEREAVQEE